VARNDSAPPQKQPAITMPNRNPLRRKDIDDDDGDDVTTKRLHCYDAVTDFG
jgi:hypothetical protein